MKRAFKNLLLFVAVLLFFIVTLPANHSEAEDAWSYARLTEQGSGGDFFQAHHLIYLPLMRGLFAVAQAAGIADRAMPVLIAFSMACGALAMVLFAALLQRAGVSRRTALPFSAALLFSYGFWRYSTTAEIYVPAAAFSLLTLYCALRAENNSWLFYAGVLSGSTAVLLHLITLPAVFAAVPLLYGLQRRRARAALHIAGVLLITGGVYAAVSFAGIQPGVFTDTLAPRGTLMEPLTWLKGLFAWGQTVLSGNFLFAVPPVAGQLTELFPFHMLQEELFAGANAPDWIRRAAPVTFGAALAVLAGFFILLFSKWRSWAIRPLWIAAMVWLVGTAGMALFFEPANPEMWISTLPPLWLSCALIWPASSGWRLPALLAGALLFHNAIGGMAVVRSPNSDYCRAKAAAVLPLAKPGDLILTADSHSFVTFLRYHTPARVLDAKYLSPDAGMTAVHETTGQVFVFSDVLDPLPPVLHRPETETNRLNELGLRLSPDLKPVGDARLYRRERR